MWEQGSTGVREQSTANFIVHMPRHMLTLLGPSWAQGWMRLIYTNRHARDMWEWPSDTSDTHLQ